MLFQILAEYVLNNPHHLTPTQSMK